MVSELSGQSLWFSPLTPFLVPNLSPEGTQLVQNLAQRHGVSTDAILHMLIAVQNGNGSMAQFNHHEFGGSGQWMRGGMTMVSDLFNNHLKSRVDNVCNDISNELANHQTSPFCGSFQSQSQNGMHSQTQAAGGIGGNNTLFVPDPQTNWWPQDLGSPSAIGSQNNARYAYFANLRRLAIATGDEVWLYDTLDHQIGGFAQQQGSGGSITLSSQFGTVNLSTLPVLSRGRVGQNSSDYLLAHPPQATSGLPLQPSPMNPTTQNTSGNEDVFAALEKLGNLKAQGIISDQDFESKKAELLSRI